MQTLPPLDAAEWVDSGSGLMTWDVTVGNGMAVQPGGRVKVHYTGWLPNGTKFDSSHDRGQPIEFSLGGVIKGWQQGIPGMKPGGVRRLFIPAIFGYGMAGIPGVIPPNAALVFEVQLLEVK